MAKKFVSISAEIKQVPGFMQINQEDALPKWFREFTEEHRMSEAVKLTSTTVKAYAVSDLDGRLAKELHSLIQVNGIPYEGRRYTSCEGWHKNYTSSKTEPWVQVEHHKHIGVTYLTYYKG